MTEKFLYKNGITHGVATQADYDHYKKLGYTDVAINGQNLVEKPDVHEVSGSASMELSGSTGVLPSVEDISDEDLKIIQKFKKINKHADLISYAQKLGDTVSKAVHDAFEVREGELRSLNDKKDGEG